jgi:hypothetical protein
MIIVLSTERESRPSEIAVPDIVHGWFGPTAAVGMATGGAAGVPSGKRSSMNTGVALFVKAADPSPTRTIRTVGVQTPPSHRFPGEVVQTVPFGAGGFDGTPFVQTSDVQSLPSTGTSLSSTTEIRFPLPSQTLEWQSPGVCVALGVPYGAYWTPHFPEVQVRWEHSVSVPAQSVGTAQFPPVTV